MGSDREGCGVRQEFYSVEDVAGLLGLHVKTVRGYVRDGKLKATRIGKQYRIARGEVEAFTGGGAGRRALRGWRSRRWCRWTGWGGGTRIAW
nr:helix-turn-helix domain-containing protein [Kitasatospora cheerisanensis]